MRSPVPALALLLAACSPTYNWRELRIDPAGLATLLPCKPDKAQREVELLEGRRIGLQALGCEAGGATFAILWADVGDAGRADQALAQWQSASLAAMAGQAARRQPFLPAGGAALSHSQQLDVLGRRADGGAVQSRAAYFARGSRVFQASIYADAVKPEMAEPFFAGLRFE